MKLVLKFLRPHIKLAIIAVLMLVLDIAGALFIPTITADIINIGVAGGDITYIIRSGLLMIAVTLVAAFGAIIGATACARLSARMARDIRNAIYQKTLTFSVSDFEKFGTSSMITRSLNDVNQIQQAVTMCLQMILPVPVICVMGVILAFRINLNMGFLLLAGIAVVLIFAYFITRKSRKTFEKMQRHLDSMGSVLRENSTGVRVIRAFNKQDYEHGRMKKTFTDYADSAIKVNKLFAAVDSFAFLIINLCIVAILWIGGNSVGAGSMQIGDIAALTEYAIMILYFIMMAQMVILILPRAQTCISRVSEVLQYDIEVKDEFDFTGSTVCHQQTHNVSGCLTKNALTSPDCTALLNDSKQIAANIQTDVMVSFNAATFRFDGADEDTLSSLSFDCKRGETLAIIGGTGSGKSTIAKLLLRFYNLTSGEILIKGNNIRNMPQQYLRRQIAYVPQKAWLFSGTIADNLRYGSVNADTTEMMDALTTAQAQDFVEKSSNGLDSFVAQGGTNFSGGQKQRLSIARALIKKADIYLFDDSFSALDAKTDWNLRKSLADRTKDAAVIIISQRISTIRGANKIAVLSDGKITGIGAHDFLMETCPDYIEIVQSQTKNE